jgi:hypothetical protein
VGLRRRDNLEASRGFVQSMADSIHDLEIVKDVEIRHYTCFVKDRGKRHQMFRGLLRPHAHFVELFRVRARLEIIREGQW